MENNSKIWTTSEEYFEHNRFKAYEKRHPLELKSCFDNVERIVDKLNEHGKISEIKFGFFRHESRGIWRIGQTGLPHAAETRLYVYLYFDGKTIYLLTIGDKKQQPDDLRRCADNVKRIKEKVKK